MLACCLQNYSPQSFLRLKTNNACHKYCLLQRLSEDGCVGVESVAEAVPRGQASPASDATLQNSAHPSPAANEDREGDSGASAPDLAL